MIRSVLCEIGDREILELTPEVGICKKKAFILTDKYTPSNIRQLAVERVNSMPSVVPTATEKTDKPEKTDKGERTSECSSGNSSPRSSSGSLNALLTAKSEKRVAAKKHSRYANLNIDSYFFFFFHIF